MDKLEIDARVARLERTVSRLWIAVGGLVLLGVGLAILGSMRPVPVAAPAAEYLPPPVPTTVASASEQPREHGTMADLERQLLQLRDLWSRGIIEAHERDAKIEQLLQQPIVPTDLTADLMRVQNLWASSVIDPQQRDALKQNLLGIAPQASETIHMPDGGRRGPE